MNYHRPDMPVKRCPDCNEPLDTSWRTCPTCSKVVVDEFPKMVRMVLLVCGTGILIIVLLVHFLRH